MFYHYLSTSILLDESDYYRWDICEIFIDIYLPKNFADVNAENPSSNDSAMHECLKIYF